MPNRRRTARHDPLAFRDYLDWSDAAFSNVCFWGKADISMITCPDCGHSKIETMLARTLGSFAIMAYLLISATAWSKKATDGEQAFKEHCSKCHARAASLLRNLKGPTTKERAATLVKFLETHHTDDVKTRTEIVDYLAGLSAE